jgi:uncharacterized protein (DUF58 family)
MWFQNIFNAKAGSRPAESAPGPFNLLSNQQLRQLSRLYLNTGPLSLAQPAGARASLHRRPASEFREHRQYTPGDDVRYVDWKASARQEHIFIKQGDTQKAALVYLLIDCSASMTWGEPAKSRAALALANALGYMALAHSDRLVVLPVGAAGGGSARGEGLQPLGPLWGQGQAPLLNQYLQAVRFAGQVDVSAALAGLRQRKLSRGGLVLVLSDLLGSGDLSASLDALPAPAWNVVFCHLLHPAELDPALDGYFEMVDIETGAKKRYPVTPRVLQTYRQRMQNWQGELSRLSLERKAVYNMIPTNWTIEDQIIPRLLRSQVVKRL